MPETRNPSLPRHIGLILDGNRRWADSKGLPTLEGHRAGYGNLKDIAKYAINQGVDYVSAYIFSTENWSRSKEEVAYLLDLALWVATREVKHVHKEGIRLRFLGRRDGLADKLVNAIESAEEQTKDNKRGTLALCFNYGGQQEIVDAAQKLVTSKNNKITTKDFANALYAPDIPDIDLLIRTSGEKRLSNFMIWRAAYAELYFTDQYWPAFSENDMDDALADFATRQRRFGN